MKECLPHQKKGHSTGEEEGVSWVEMGAGKKKAPQLDDFPKQKRRGPCVGGGGKTGIS